MIPYGARRRMYSGLYATTRPKYIRGNRGRGPGAWLRSERTRGRVAIDRAMARRERRRAREAIALAVYDAELAAYDPEIWAWGTNLTTFADLRPKGRARAAYRVYLEETWCDHDYDDAYDPYEDPYYDPYDDYAHDSDPEEWRDAWVDGWSPYDDPYDDGWSGDVYDVENPLVVDDDTIVVTDHTDPALERNLERHRAGERYYRQHRRTRAEGVAPARR